MLGNTAFEAGRFAQAEQYSQQLLALTAEGDKGRGAVVERLATAIYKQGEQAREAGQGRAAAELFARVGSAAPQSSVRVNAQFDAATELLSLKDWAGATRLLEDFRQRFASHPLQAQVPVKLALAYSEQGQWSPAATEFERLSLAEPDPERARAALWQAAELQGKAVAQNGAASSATPTAQRLCCARVCHQPSAKALKTMLGTGAATNSFDDIEHTSLFMLCGCNPTENHPIVGARIKQAVRAGAGLIVIDPRRTELAACADIHLALRPGTNVLLFNAMAATMLEEGLQDDDYIAMRVDGLAGFRSFIAAYAPEQVACQCGVKAGDIRRAARMYALAKPAMCFHGLGMTEHLQGTQGVMSLINLALLTGNLGKRGSGINPLRGQNNVQGSAQMGCEPASLTGAQNLADAKVRASFEQAWSTTLPTSAGLDLPAMLAAASLGKFKAMWVMGYDIAMSMPNANQTLAALEQLELVIVQDLFLNETARAVGHVFFPAASVFEKDGSFMNADRRVQRVRQVVNSPGEAKPDWQIIKELARRMGHEQGFTFDDPQAIWDEIRSVWPASAGLSYQRLQNESLQWPCPASPDDNHPGTAILHKQGFGVGPKASLACIAYQPTAEVCDDDYPLLLTTGRELYHFNAGTMTHRTPNAQLKPTDTLDISPADAQYLNLSEGQQAQVCSRYGIAILPVHITEKMQVGQLFCSFHRADLNVNALTSPYCDNLVHAPEYKVTAVKVKGLAGGRF